MRCIPTGPHAGCTAYQARFKEDCPAKMVKFGQEVEYYPIDPTPKGNTQKYGEKTKKAIFMGYKLANTKSLATATSALPGHTSP